MVGYRTESCYGSGIRDVISIITYEIFELGNTDILETLANTILKKSSMSEKIKEYVKELGENGCINNLSNKTEFVKELLDSIYHKTGKKVKYALWLADKESVKKKYNALSDDDIDAYKTSSIILSDLGSSGKLYGYEEMPILIESLDVC